LDHFGLLAPFYEQVIRPPDADYLMRLLDPHPAHRLLDVGGGTGRVAQHFQDMFRDVLVLDVSLGMLIQAQAKDALRPLLGESERLPFTDGSFERVLAVDSFHHFRDQGRASEELVRVLAPGGRLVIEEPNIEHFPVKLVAFGEKLLLMRSHFYHPRELKALFDKLGYMAKLYVNGSSNYWVVVTRV
jgi:demethylmenaquinone methyltransferase/2-methoxy-6-polyprenyl-1,4-benzoquinol methylase